VVGPSTIQALQDMNPFYPEAGAVRAVSPIYME